MGREEESKGGEKEARQEAADGSWAAGERREGARVGGVGCGREERMRVRRRKRKKEKKGERK